ncbi:MAG TPA: hypothetical protein VN515_03265 [Terriglobales bacterium]|nr:hypothetical protein [Terriglobales bacterium]
MKKLQPQPRRPLFNRFQTAVSGLTYVHTAVDSHFDPYAEPRPQLSLTEAQMEKVERVEISRP